MINISQLSDALRYENLRPLYQGDIFLDAHEVIENYGDRSAILADIKDHVFSECLSQLPGEDFLQDQIADILFLIKNKSKKADLVEGLKHLEDQLEAIQLEIARGAEYARHELKNLK